MNSLNRFSRLYSVSRKFIAGSGNIQHTCGCLCKWPSKFNCLVSQSQKRYVQNTTSVVEEHVEDTSETSLKQNADDTPDVSMVEPVDFDNNPFADSILKGGQKIKKMRNPFYNIEYDYEKHDPADAPHFIDDINATSPVSFNLATYANKSPTLQKLIQLGVDLSKFEEKPEQAKMLMLLDFEKDVQPYIQFLHDKGVSPNEIGIVLTKNAMLLKEDIENLQIRINYLQSKKFTANAIARIISKNAYHLMMDTKSVDRRLGFFQKTFHLTGDEVRFLVTKYPKLVSYKYIKLMDKIFVFKEIMGFSHLEMKEILLMKPKVFTIAKNNLEERFQIVHNTMGLSHDQILKFPGVLLKRGFILEQRHKYLVHLGRAQYDATKPGYVPLIDIATTTDNVFCRRCAKTSVAEYNEFLKTV